MNVLMKIIMNINRSFHNSTDINPLGSEDNDKPSFLLDMPSSNLAIGFNEDFQCFFSATETGFYIYNTSPFIERFHREMDGGIGIVELLGKSNIVALVGGGNNPKFSPTNVIMWDDYQNMPIAKLEYGSEVKAVRCRGQRVLVVFSTRVMLYNFSDLHLIGQYETCLNPGGLCAMISQESVGRTVIAIPGCKIGDLRIEIVEAKKSFAIQAHQRSLSNIALTRSGAMCATASDRGTIIRIWKTEDGSLARELRRGLEPAGILSLNFNPTADGLCLTSDKGTVHIYSLVERKDAADHEKNKKSSLSFMKNYLPGYFSSEWSQTSFSVPGGKRSICAFSPEDSNVIIILTEDGKFYQYRYLPGQDHVQLIKTEKF